MKQNLLIFFAIFCGAFSLYATNGPDNSTLLTKHTNDLITDCDGVQIAYWDMDGCASFPNDGSPQDYSEFTAVTNAPAGITSVNASLVTSDDQHSCVVGQSGYAMCHDIQDGCSWSDNSSDAIRFSVTINPENGSTAGLTRLTFYERATHNFVHNSGNSGDNDPPSRYGIRVLKNGQEIFQSTNISTTEPWSLEQFDFSNDADFEVTSTTTFDFELLGYCVTNDNGGLSAWDVDEIKVFGCAESNDPCAGQGGDSDGDGVCDNQDCQPNNNFYPATPGTSCNDGNPNTENDVVAGDGCNCAGTPVSTCDVTTGNCSITISGLSGSDNAKVFDASWNVVWQCHPWGGTLCTGTETITDLSNGTYWVQACGETTQYTVSGCSVDPCAGQGGDSDGDGVCDNQDCQPNNNFYPAIPGTACNDGNPNTTNDVVQGDGCSCAGTTVDPCAGQGGDSDGDGVCNNVDNCPNTYNPGQADSNNNGVGDACDNSSTCGVITGNCMITITGLSASDNAKIFDATWNVVWQCDPWGNGSCNGTETITNLSNGSYWVQACGETVKYTVTGCGSTDPCAGQGGDSDGDGLCDNQDCAPNNSNLPITPGTACNDGNSNTENDVIGSDGCSCAGTPIQGECSVAVTYSNIQCDGQGTATVNDDMFTVDVLVTGNNTGNQWQGTLGGQSQYGNYGVVKTYGPFPTNSGSSISGWFMDTNDSNCAFDIVVTPPTGCSTDPCAGQGGDSDGDGVCNNQDNCPNTYNPGQADSNNNGVGDACDNSSTCGVTTGNCSITISGLSASDNAKVFTATWSVIWQCDPWGNGNCTGTETITDLVNGDYWVQACGETVKYTVTGCGSTDPCAGQGGDSDGDGVCNNQDCQPNNNFYPATPGTSCNDGNPNTTNDVVQGDGCSCAGTMVDPCAGQGGDSDGDGVCNNQDNCPNTYNPNQADSNNNGVGDVCDNSSTCSVTTGNCSITISGIASNDYIKVFDSSWSIVWDCNPWSNGGCGETETITDLMNGTYWVQACGETTQYTVSGCTTDPCAGQGGDSDGDGVCDNQDCAPNNSALPAAAGTPCNDGNPNTQNDVIQGDGCTCQGIVIDPCAGQGGDSDGDGVCNNQDNCPNTANPNQADSNNNGVGDACDVPDECTGVQIAYWDMDGCESFPGTNSPQDYSEFTAVTNAPTGITSVNASLVTSDEGHSCVVGQNGLAMCHDIRDNCSWTDNANDAIRFSVTVNPSIGSTVSLTRLRFFERAPESFSHISGNTGDNDPPSHYGIRVLKNGQEIFQSTDNNTTENWTAENFDFTNDSDFDITSTTTFDFELLGYCRQGSGGLSVWDVDEIKVFACGIGGSPTVAPDSELLYFYAEKDGREVDLNWTTNTDFKNDYFVIERSYDGINFEEMTTVSQTGATTEALVPVYYDTKDRTPYIGVNTYRLKQVYLDGTFTYSEERTVAFDVDVYEFATFPNPTRGEVYVNLKELAGKQATIFVYDILGKPLRQIEIASIPETPVRIDLSQYASGLYSIRVQADGVRSKASLINLSKF